MALLQEYPKTVKLANDTEVIIRVMEEDDKQQLLNFMTALPQEDRAYLKDDVTDPEFIDLWIGESKREGSFTLLAEKEGAIIGEANLHRSRYGWAKHVGEIRVIVAPEHKRKGLGTILARETFHQALRLGLDKLQVLLMPSQVGAIKAFKRAGFKKEAELKDHVIDQDGNKHNLIIMTRSVRKLVQKIDDLISSMELKIEDRIPE